MGWGNNLDMVYLKRYDNEAEGSTGTSNIKSGGEGGPCWVNGMCEDSEAVTRLLACYKI